jgi:hypothetical protein
VNVDAAWCNARRYGAAMGTTPAAGAPAKPRRFHGSVTLDPTRLAREAGRIADEVIAHLAGLVGSRVKVTLEVEDEVPSGVPDPVVRTVTENSRADRWDEAPFSAKAYRTPHLGHSPAP